MYREHVYLAAPYSSPDPAIRQMRFEQINRAAAALMRQGHIVFSPISMGHPIAEACPDVPGDFAYWKFFCLSFLVRWADRIVVLTLPGWEQSAGVKAEMAKAQDLRLEVDYLAPESLCLKDTENQNA